MANQQTPGFRRDLLLKRSFFERELSALDGAGRAFGENPRGSISHGVAVSEIATMHTEGSLVHTGKALNIALAGEGYFLVATPEGDRLTRNGNFRIDEEGFLVTQDGHYLLGENGVLQAGEDPEIDFRGNVYVGGEFLDTLALAAPPAGAELLKEGHSLFRVAEEDLMLLPAAPAVHQGYLESSNVDLAREMVSLVRLRRSYEAARSVVDVYDKLLARSANEIASLR